MSQKTLAQETLLLLKVASYHHYLVEVLSAHTGDGPNRTKFSFSSSHNATANVSLTFLIIVLSVEDVHDINAYSSGPVSRNVCPHVSTRELFG